MAALCTGNYGLSQNCTDDSKEYFFVKLTDSAYRAVEEYQRNQNKYNTHATIQILENGGILSFPTTSGNVGQQFSFSIDEIEGSFECIRQTQNQLDVLGSLPYKMRVHANEDVYETTRYRMAVAEENQKNKCTREIKPNQTDIGRKVKLKNSSNRLTNIPQKRDQALTNTSQSPLSSLTNSSNALSSNAIVNGSTPTTSPIVNNGSSSSSFASTNLNGPPNSGSINSCSNIRNNNLTTSSLNSITSNSSKLPPNCNSSSTGLATAVSSAFSLSSALSSAAGSGTSGISSGYFSNSNTGIRPANGLIVGNSSLNGAGSRRGTTGVTGNNSRGQKNGSRHTPDISKRKIRERLIHLLALKPFKKPELYTRLQNEGIRDREKSLISAILKEISTMRDNTYNLKRQVWNDVNEDWPFYTEQEIQMLKRRKPQNLTPPLSSDGGSSTSGQSPTSTHNGSPPPAVKRPSLDRDRFYEEPIAKKQRISHFRKDANEINSSSIATSKHQQESEDNHMSLSYSVLGTEATRRISPREEVNNGNNNSYQQINSHHHSSNNNCSSNKNSNNVGINSNGNGRQQSPSSYSHLNCSNKSNSSDDSRRQSSSPVTVGNLTSSISTSPGIGSQNCISTIDMTDPEATIPSTKPCHNQGSSNMNSNSTGGPFKNNAYDFSRFTKITSIEQRRLYKTEFENDYDEYRELLNKIESVGQRFKVLAQRLNNARNNDANYRVIKRQILAEYEKINRDHEHKRTRARFDYLHAKLAHIKALVSEFDKTITSSSSPSSVPALNSDQCGSYNANRNRLSSTSPLQNLGSSVHMSNGSNSNITNPSGTLRTSPNSHSIAQAYLTSSSSPNLHHVPKQENY